MSMCSSASFEFEAWQLMNVWTTHTLGRGGHAWENDGLMALPPLSLPSQQQMACCTRHASWIWGAGVGTSDIPVLGSGYIAYMAQLGDHQVAAWHVWRLYIIQGVEMNSPSFTELQCRQYRACEAVQYSAERGGRLSIHWHCQQKCGHMGHGLLFFFHRDTCRGYIGSLQTKAGPGWGKIEGVPGGHSFGGGIGAWRDMHSGVAYYGVPGWTYLKGSRGGFSRGGAGVWRDMHPDVWTYMKG